MSDNPTLGFGKFVPGFDFLQNLAKGAGESITQLPNLSSWIAPTLSVEELEKRVGELKAVHFWLEQNSKALAATIQALEVQKMTLATLKGMNMNMAEMASALHAKTVDAMAAGAEKAGDAAASAADAAAGAGRAARGGKASAKGGDGEAAEGKSAAGLVDPLQWWGALTQQFQQIAADAMKDAARNPAFDSARNMAAGMARDAAKGASDVMRAASGAATGATTQSAATKSTPTKSAAPRKAARKSPARKRASTRKT